MRTRTVQDTWAMATACEPLAEGCARGGTGMGVRGAGVGAHSPAHSQRSRPPTAAAAIVCAGARSARLFTCTVRGAIANREKHARPLIAQPASAPSTLLSKLAEVGLPTDDACFVLLACARQGQYLPTCIALVSRCIAAQKKREPSWPGLMQRPCLSTRRPSLLLVLPPLLHIRLIGVADRCCYRRCRRRRRMMILAS